jgi:Molybdopterin oxidoreductase Fe4S4 domain
MSRTALRVCSLCEATCGLTLTIEDRAVTHARGDREDVFSAGSVCPEGAAFGALDADPGPAVRHRRAQRLSGTGRAGATGGGRHTRRSPVGTRTGTGRETSSPGRAETEP